MGPAGGPKTVRFRGIPKNPPGPPGGQKSAHFVGYLINLPFGTNMAPLFLGFLDPPGQTWDPPKRGSGYPPKTPPLWTPPFLQIPRDKEGPKGSFLGVFWDPFWTPFGPPMDPPGTPPGGPPRRGGARGGPGAPPGARGAPGAKIRISRPPAGDPQNGQKTPFLGVPGQPPMGPPFGPTGQGGPNPPLHPPPQERCYGVDHAALLRHACRSLSERTQCRRMVRPGSTIRGGPWTVIGRVRRGGAR